jgi:hypothetical protein
MLIIKSVFEKNANFFAEKCQKLQKMVIITSTPGHTDFVASAFTARKPQEAQCYNSDHSLPEQSTAINIAANHLYVDLKVCSTYIHM